MASGEQDIFRCPCCGGVFPIDRLNGDGPYPFEQTTRHFGGKVALTDEELEWRDYEPKGRGSGHGLIVYDPWAPPVPELIESFRRRLQEVEDQIGG